MDASRPFPVSVRAMDAPGPDRMLFARSKLYDWLGIGDAVLIASASPSRQNRSHESARDDGLVETAIRAGARLPHVDHVLPSMASHACFVRHATAIHYPE